MSEQVVEAMARAMSGVEVWVGFRDEAGDDDCASGTVDFDDLRILARYILRDKAAMAALDGRESREAGA